MNVYKPDVNLMIEKHVHRKHANPVHHPENQETAITVSIEEIKNQNSP